MTEGKKGGKHPCKGTTWPFSLPVVPRAAERASIVSKAGIMSLGLCVHKGLGVHTRLGSWGLN